MSTSYSLSQFGVKNNLVFRSSIVDLVNKSQQLLDEIDKTSIFGSKFHELVGDQVQKFLDAIKDVYEKYHVDNIMSVDYRVSDSVWFYSKPIRGYIKNGKFPLSKSSLITIISALIAQLRDRVNNLERMTIQGQFSTNIKSALETCLGLIPPQIEKEITIKRYVNADDNENDDDNNNNNNEKDDSTSTSEVRKIMVPHEQFIDTIAAAFSEAAKAQRVHAAKNKKIEPSNNQSEKGWTKVNSKGKK